VEADSLVDYGCLVTSRPHDHGHGHEVDHDHPIDHDEKKPELEPEPKTSETTISKSPTAAPPAALSTEISRLLIFLRAHFGPIPAPLLTEEPGQEDSLLILTINVDGHTATVDLMTMVVTCPHAGLRKRVVGVLEMALGTMTSLAKGFVGARAGKRKAEEEIG
jgi:cleavage and polyadenylation specificity factor subunit 3